MTRTRKTTGVATAAALAIVLAACGNGGDGGDEGADGGTLQIAALEGGYGTQLYHDVIEAFEAEHEGVTVELQISRSIEDEISPNMQAGRFPDLVLLGQGRQAGLTETFIRDENLEELTDVLGMTVPGEDVTVGEKIQDGVIGSLGTNPYGDDRTFLMPLNYAPTGLVYDQGFFAEQGWEVPTTWDEMFQLGEDAQGEDVWLFTYPTAGYLDSYFASLLGGIGGADFFQDVMTYTEGVWRTPEAEEAIALTTELLQEHTNPNTVGYANEQDFMRNQQSILDRESLFMPNGTWIDGEMADAPRPDDFQWGLAPLPTVDADGERYITTSIETIWMPAEADQKDLAREFIAFLYSVAAVEIFADSGAVQPVEGVVDLLSEDLAAFYQVYEEPGVQAIVGGFASTPPVEGVSIQSTLYETADSIVTGDTTPEEWLAELDSVSERLREASEADQG